MTQSIVSITDRNPMKFVRNCDGAIDARYREQWANVRYQNLNNKV